MRRTCRYRAVCATIRQRGKNSCQRIKQIDNSYDACSVRAACNEVVNDTGCEIDDQIKQRKEPELTAARSAVKICVVFEHARYCLTKTHFHAILIRCAYILPCPQWYYNSLADNKNAPSDYQSVFIAKGQELTFGDAALVQGSALIHSECRLKQLCVVAHEAQRL